MQVYTVDAVPYESLMVGLFVIIECDSGGEGCDQEPDHEMDEVFVAFSRDGFSWSRPPAPRVPLAAMNTDNISNWNWFDVQAAAGAFITMPDKLLMCACASLCFHNVPVALFHRKKRSNGCKMLH